MTDCIHEVTNCTSKWLTVPISWLTVPSKWLTLLSYWLSLPSKWLTVLYTDFELYPVTDSDWPTRVTDIVQLDQLDQVTDCRVSITIEWWDRR